jgi:hypothetical protein
MESARRALSSYARACDAQDLVGLQRLFAKECELEIPGRSWRGRDDVIGFFRDAWREDPSQKSHFVTNVECECVGPGLVAVAAYFLYTAAGDHSSVLGWGRYRDLVDTAGSQPLFRHKWMAVTRAVDVREGWAL